MKIRLIDANALLYRSRRIAGMMELQVIPEWCVKEAPTIDAVPVVRCRDCIYRDQAMRCIAMYYGFNPHDEWFCANGARMDGEDDE